MSTVLLESAADTQKPESLVLFEKELQTKMEWIFAGFQMPSETIQRDIAYSLVTETTPREAYGLARTTFFKDIKILSAEQRRQCEFISDKILTAQGMLPYLYKDAVNDLGGIEFIVPSDTTKTFREDVDQWRKKHNCSDRAHAVDYSVRGL